MKAVEDMVAAAMASLSGIAGETGQGLGHPAMLTAAMASLGGATGDRLELDGVRVSQRVNERVRLCLRAR